MSVNSSSLALPGLSGYDFTSIVESMVQVYKLPENQMVQQQSKLQVSKDAWRDIKTRLSALENTLTALRDAPTWTATKATSNNTDLLTVTSSANATQGTYSVTVKSIAKAQTIVTKVLSVKDANTALSGITPVWSGDGSWDFKIKDQDPTKEDITINIKKSLTSGGTPSLKDIQDAINTAKAGVTASVIQVGVEQYRLAITSNQTGVANIPVFKSLDGTTNTPEIFNSLGISLNQDSGKGIVGAVLPPLDPNAANTDIGFASVEAKDAEMVLNGITVKSATNAITTALPGVTFNLNSEDAVKTATINVNVDNSVAQKAIQSFVDQYNSVMDFISNKMSYDKDTKKMGDLFGDPMLQAVQARLRQMVTGRQNNPTEPYSALSDIGVGTSSDNYGKDAKLSFNTSKFSTAMAENPQSVANLLGASFGGVYPITDSKDSVQAQGLANIMKEYLHPMVMYQGSLDKMQDNLGKRIEDVKDRISDFEDRAAAYEERMRLKFAALEATLSKLNSENTWLTGQINAMTAQKK